MKFEGITWKLRCDAAMPLIALETRQTEQLQATFQVINAVSGQVLLHDFKCSERWWTGLEDICNGILLLHGYGKKQENGEHQGLQAIEAISGKMLWQNSELTYLGLLSETEVLVFNATGKLEKIALRSGEGQPYSGDFQSAKKNIEVFSSKHKEGLQLPVPYLETDTHYKLLQDFIFQKTGKEAVKTIEYLETEKAVVLSFYSGKDSVLANFLVVCSTAGEVQTEVCLQAKSAGIGMDTFFIFAGKLFFIQDKTALCAVSL